MLTDNARPATILRQPEEQTDNWDDDFEGVVSMKLQG